jgi:hypothetical protein
MRIIFLFVFTVFASTCLAQTNYRPYVLGEWQCQTNVTTQYGNSLVVGQVVLHDDGSIQGSGDLLIGYPGIKTEIPLAATLEAKWSFTNNKIIVSEIAGDIVSPYSLLNGLANNLKQSILQQQQVKLQLVKIGKQYLAVRAEDNTEIQCIRSSLE